jgi:hypothetical protein
MTFRTLPPKLAMISTELEGVQIHHSKCFSMVERGHNFLSEDEFSISEFTFRALQVEIREQLFNQAFL